MTDNLKITVQKWTLEEERAITEKYTGFRKFWDTITPWYKLEEPYSEAGAQRFRDAMKYGRDGWPVPKRLNDVAVNIPVPSSTGNQELYVRIFRSPAPSKGVYLHIHGGGWTIGSADIEDEIRYRVAQNTEYTVASVEYRLAPKHRYPKAIDDCLDAALFFLQPDMEQQYGALRILGGESSGGHLAMAVAFRLRKSGVNVRKQLDCLIFNHAVFDLSLTNPSVHNATDTVFISTEDMEAFTKAWIQDLDPHNPDISPLYESDFSEMPPAIFQAGTKDLLYDDSLLAAIKWHLAGNDTQLVISPGSDHGFSHLGGPEMEASLTAGERFIQAHSSGSVSGDSR